jgi:hypothetical protein
MSLRRLILCSVAGLLLSAALYSQRSSTSSPNPHPSQKAVRLGHSDPVLDAGSVDGGVYRKTGLGFSCKIPDGWVLRTEEMNAREEDDNESKSANPDADKQSGAENPSKESQPPRTRSDTKETQHSAPSGRVLLAAFSRPPEATGEDVNSSILIVAESVAAYPGLKEAGQYFGPVGEVAKAQGFKVVEEPYEFVVGTKRLVREDFQKDVGTRVLRQSTLVMLARGYVVSFTFIGGTEDEVEELVGGLGFGVGGNTSRSK